ncbi:MAG TPA: hypothetical protein V6C85_16325 [Allocoleopsis sp.]
MKAITLQKSSKTLLIGLLLSGLTTTVLIQPAGSAPTAQPATPNPSNNVVLFYHGVWTGTYATVGSQGRVQLYIDPSEQLHGSLASNDGQHFAQISGDHRGNEFHLVFTPPAGVTNQFGDPSPVEVDATAKWEKLASGSARIVLITRTRTGHTQRYEFERVKVIQ